VLPRHAAAAANHAVTFADADAEAAVSFLRYRLRRLMSATSFSDRFTPLLNIHYYAFSDTSIFSSSPLMLSQLTGAPGFAPPLSAVPAPQRRCAAACRLSCMPPPLKRHFFHSSLRYQLPAEAYAEG